MPLFLLKSRYNQEMPTGSEVLDRIFTKIFEIKTPEEMGVTRVGPHRKPFRLPSGKIDFGHVYFECGGLMFYVAHDIGKSFRVAVLGHRKSDQTGYPMPLDEVFLSFDELPTMIPLYINHLFVDFPNNRRDSRARIEPEPVETPERDRKKNPSKPASNWREAFKTNPDPALG
jgi:hypothetical protein